MVQNYEEKKIGKIKTHIYCIRKIKKNFKKALIIIFY